MTHSFCPEWMSSVLYSAFSNFNGTVEVWEWISNLTHNLLYHECNYLSKLVHYCLINASKMGAKSLCVNTSARTAAATSGVSQQAEIFHQEKWIQWQESQLNHIKYGQQWAIYSTVIYIYIYIYICWGIVSSMAQIMTSSIHAANSQFIIWNHWWPFIKKTP